jgi:hypothetical protein
MSTHDRLAEAWRNAAEVAALPSTRVYAVNNWAHHLELAWIERQTQRHRNTPPWIRVYVDDETGAAILHLGLNHFGAYVSASASAEYSDLR